MKKQTEVIENQAFDEERAFYGRENILVKDCSLMDLQMARAHLKNAEEYRLITTFSISVILSGMIMGL